MTIAAEVPPPAAPPMSSSAPGTSACPTEKAASPHPSTPRQKGLATGPAHGPRKGHPKGPPMPDRPTPFNAATAFRPPDSPVCRHRRGTMHPRRSGQEPPAPSIRLPYPALCLNPCRPCIARARCSGGAGDAQFCAGSGCVGHLNPRPPALALRGKVTRQGAVGEESGDLGQGGKAGRGGTVQLGVVGHQKGLPRLSDNRF